MEDPTREARMLHDLRSANEGPLSDDGVRSLLNAILDLTRREVSQ
jgi:chorismate mutase